MCLAGPCKTVTSFQGYVLAGSNTDVAYGGPEGPCQTNVYKFNIFKLISDVSNLEISQLDISKIFSYRFCTPVSMDSLDGEAVALA